MQRSKCFVEPVLFVVMSNITLDIVYIIGTKKTVLIEIGVHSGYVILLNIMK